jgi:malate dehydrogenase (oxaloacetate-decarboxylating)
MRREGATTDDAARAIVVCDRKGVLHEGRDIAESFKREFALSKQGLATYGLDAGAGPDPVGVIRAFKPTVLVGATAQPGAFTKEMIQEMAKHVERPLVMPLSNPTSKAECSAKEAIEWTDGRGLVATGSPFGDVVHKGRRHAIGQANNVFVSPRVGLGAVVSEAREVDDEMFFIAAKILARCVSLERLEMGAIYSREDELREV